MNTTKTIILMVALTMLLVTVGGALAGQNGMIMAFIFASVMNVISYWFSDKIVLRMYNAREVTESEAPVLYGITRDLAQRMNMPMPRVYIIPSEALNAFATGRNPNHAAVAANHDDHGHAALLRLPHRRRRGQGHRSVRLRALVLR